jgi:FkbM family methyltransferase
MYSQNLEQKYILEYFAGKTGTLLSIGENDGKTLSNSLALIERGWKAILVEPGETAFSKLSVLHEGNKSVTLLNVAISDKVGVFDFYESENHKHCGPDNYGLLSTLDENEIARWKGTEKFNKKQVQCIDYKTLIKEHGEIFRFISIDAEGFDLIILKQIDLSFAQLICIEWNNDQAVKDEIVKYCSTFRLNKLIYQSGENLLIAR